MSQDAVHTDQEIMTRIQTLVEKLQAGYHAKSIIDDLGKKRTSNTLSKASRRTIKELGIFELYQLGEISKTVQCPTCLRYVEEGIVYCTCGVCFMPSPEKTKKSKTDSRSFLHKRKGVWKSKRCIKRMQKSM